MALDPKAEAALALHRFGLGPRAGSIAAIASDPRGALLAELDRPGAGRIADSDLLTSGAAARAVAFQQKAQRQNARAAAALSRRGQGAHRCRARRRDRLCRAAGLVLVEPFLRFRRQGPVRAMAGAYEREAIRPHVLGRFADMLLAVETHPAMLIYLDNARSIGPNSPAGKNRGRGLNENLAREILELHTLGVRTVYTQADVTSFAKVITGWTIVPPRQDPEHGGEFVFNPRMHEPGAQTVIGKTYPTPASSRAARCSPISRAIRRRRSTSRPSSRAISSPTIRRRRWSSGWRSASSTPTAISRRWRRRWSPRRRPGRRRAASSSGRANGSSARCARPASTRRTSGR